MPEMRGTGAAGKGFNMTLFGKRYKITRPNSQKVIGRLADRNYQCQGMICHSEGRIRIYRYLSAHDTLKTYFHELCHALCKRRGLLKIHENEKIIDLLADGLTAWAEENGIKVKIK